MREGKRCCGREEPNLNLNSEVGFVRSGKGGVRVTRSQVGQQVKVSMLA